MSVYCLCDKVMDSQKNTQRKGILLIVCLLFEVYGILLSWYIYDHYSYAIEICKNPTNAMLIEQPALKLWKYCEYPTYPLFYNIPCNCRSFTLILDVMF